MSSPIPGLQDALTRLGLKSGDIPTLGTDQATGVVILEDLHDALSSGLFEARGIVSWDQTSPAGFYPYFELVSRAPGGIAIEKVVVRNVVGDGISLGITPVSFLTGAAVSLAIGDVGGDPTASLAASDGNVPVLPPGDVTVYVTFNTLTELPLERIYVPPGNSFFVAAQFVAGRVQGFVIWRELASIQRDR